jgi:isoquinoline 1-oxidoreductase beta subunit
MPVFNQDRRRFLKLSASISGAALVIGVNWSCTDSTSQQNDDQQSFVPNAWLKINSDDSIIIIVAESEMGQGTYTSLPMMVAEELEVEWSRIQVQRAPLDPMYGYQLTGGSNSIRKAWNVLRQAGAVARETLVRAAVRDYRFNYADCRAENGNVHHLPSDRLVSYGQLIKTAASMSLPDQVSLKRIDEFHTIGQPVQRTDVSAKLNGEALFGCDLRLPGQLYATVVHPPVLGGRALSVNSRAARDISALVDVFPIEQGVAVVAQDTWSAMQAAKRVEIEWETGDAESLSTESIYQRMREAKAADNSYARTHGDVNEAYDSNKTIRHSHYLQPFHAHMTMEPMNCTAHVEADGAIRVWAPTQSPSRAYETVSELTQSSFIKGLNRINRRLFGQADDSVEINTTLLGGGFGRRLQQDFVSEAVQVASRFDHPIQLQWTRSEDVQHDFYHPASYHEMQAALDEQGLPIAWTHIVKGSGIGLEGTDHSYQIPHRHIQQVNVEHTVPTGPWRSVGFHYNVFAVEHFFDELAYQSARDPLEMRLQLLENSSRLRQVLLKVADHVNWPGASSSRGRLMGTAVMSGFGSHVAQIVELETVADEQYRVDRVCCVIDCGIVINPDIARQQIEGSIVFALSAAMKQGIRIEQGKVVQSNFHDYPILRLNEVPEIDIILVDSTEDPGGIGEPGVPPLAPALANAILSHSGRATHELPFVNLGG